MHREVREGAGAGPRDPAGQRTKKIPSALLPFLRRHGAPPPNGASEKWGRKLGPDPTLWASHGSRRYRSSGPVSQQSCVQSFPLSAAR